MPRVKCPHCGAGNQDAADTDTCWQCGEVLLSPVARSKRGFTVPLSANPTRALDASALREARSGGAAPSWKPWAVAAAVLIVGALVITFLVRSVQSRRAAAQPPAVILPFR